MVPGGPRTNRRSRMSGLVVVMVVTLFLVGRGDGSGQ
jgi:hypothetical protein